MVKSTTQQMVFLGILITFVIVTFAGNVSIKIADLDGAGMKHEEIVIASDKLRSSILDYSKYQIIDENTPQAESGTLKQFGAVFDDVESEHVVNKKANFDFIQLSGRISKADNITMIAIRVVNRSTSEIICAKSKVFELAFKDLVSIEIPNFAKELVAEIDSTLKELTYQDENGVLFISSEPEAGTVHVDGVKTPYTTPATIKDIPAGSHSVSVNSGKKIGFAKVKIVPGKLFKTVVQLENGYGSMLLLSSPSGLNVEIESLGNYVTPVEIDSVAAGVYTLKSINDGYFSIYDTITITCNNSTEINLVTERLSWLQIDSVTSDSRVKLDNTQLDMAISNLYTVVPGEHILTIERRGFFSRSFRLKTIPGDTTTHTVRYAPFPAALSIQSEPQKASIVLNGRDAGQTPLVLPSLVPGSYKIQLKHPCYIPIDMNVNLIPGAKMDVTESFKDYSESYYQWKKKQSVVQYFNFAFAGSGQLFLSHTALDFSLLGAGLISDLILFTTCYQGYEHRRDYRHATDLEIINDQKKLMKQDYVKISAAALSSLSLRAGTFFLTRLKKGY
ncbi:MAG TPA: PEGA domain-containing protein [Chitinispirillaceae bacterium]|nr:PEGA domain-containing protein [Chitinispirillaceae bacterium]